jgi:hypothetical protein
MANRRSRILDLIRAGRQPIEDVGYDEIEGIPFDGPPPAGPLHGEPKAMALGKPRMPNRKMRKVAKGRTAGFTNG